MTNKAKLTNFAVGDKAECRWSFNDTILKLRTLYPKDNLLEKIAGGIPMYGSTAKASVNIFFNTVDFIKGLFDANEQSSKLLFTYALFDKGVNILFSIISFCVETKMMLNL